MMYPKPPKRKPRERRTRRHEAYRKARREYLGAHPYCQVCQASSASTVHHKAGRLGSLLTDPDNLLAVCDPCHEWLHHNPSIAYERGFMEKRNNADE